MEEATTPKTAPAIADIAASLGETPEQLQAQISNVTTAVLEDLVSGKSPLQSKTLITNLVFVLAGLAGTAYTAYTTGGDTQLYTCLVGTGVAFVNMVLRFFTTGPVLTDAMSKIMTSLTNVKVS